MITTNCEGKDAEKDLVTPPRKKLKQARLSFQKLSPSVENTSPKAVKKRKISEDPGDEIKIVKVIKPNIGQPSNHEEIHSEAEVTEVKDKELKDEKHVSKEEKHPLKVSDDLEIESSNSELVIVEDNEKELKNASNSTDNNFVNNEAKNKFSKSGLGDEKPKLSASEELSASDKIADKTNDSSNEQKDTDSDCSEPESNEVSDDDEVNETIEDLNSSSSCNDAQKGDDTSPCSPKDSVKNTNKVLPHTPKNSLPSPVVDKKRKLTPKQLLLREENAKKREEKKKLKEEKERQRAEEKERKLKEKEEKREQKEQRRKEKEEKEKKKLAELEQKSEEKRLKEEEKRLKEEERRKKEEQRVLEKQKKDERRLAEEEAKKKEEEVKKKEAAAFANFFVSSKGGSKTTDEVKAKIAEHFMPFEVKVDMRLAPAVRTTFDVTRMEMFDTVLSEQSASDLYLTQLKKDSYIPGNSGKTWPLSDLRDIKEEDDDVIPVTSNNEVVESHPALTHHKAKLLLFCENRRPPYWGTWRKKSKKIKPTFPFNKDEGFFDYEVDSDDEWEEEEPGESLHGSDDEKESEDEYEVDNEFFVPHGYLSDEENNEEEEETVNPETMKAKLKFLEMEFNEEMKHKTERIKPRLFGCFWANQISNPVGDRVLELLSSYRAVFQENPITLIPPSSEVNSPVSENQGTCPSTGSKKKKFPESYVPALIKLIHGNINGHGFLVKEFSSYMRNELHSAREELDKGNENNSSTNPVFVSKIKISEKIKQLASRIPCPEEGPFLNRICWYVSSEIRTAYGLEDLVIPNKVWNYINTPKREIELSNNIPSPVVSDVNIKPKSLPLITKFTKKLSQEERQRQLALAGSSGDGDIEVLNVKGVSTAEDNGNTSLPLITKFTKKLSPEERQRQLALAGSSGDGDIEVLNVEGVSTAEDNGNTSSREECCETNDSLIGSGLTENSHVTPLRAGSKLLSNGKSKKSPKDSDMRKKLLQFKSKGPSIVDHLGQRKKVPILKSAPLGQEISSTKNVCLVSQGKKSNCNELSSNNVEETSNDDDCIVLD